MANEQNLIPAKKGEIRNPKGREKGTRNRATIVKQWLDVIEKTKNPITKEIEELSQADKITLAMINKAFKGDVAAFKELMDSAYGKNKDIQETTIDVKPTRIVFKKFNEE